MASFADLFTGMGGGGGGASGTVGGNPYELVSPTGIPEIAELAGLAKSSVPTTMPSLQSLIQGGMQSPLLQEILGPMLQRLVAPQAQQRQQLTDAARVAGGLRGGSYMNSYNRLLNQQGLQQNDLMAQILSQTLNPLLQAQLQAQQNLFRPAAAYTDILQALRPDLVRGGVAGGGGGAGGDISSLGLATPMASDLMGPAGGVSYATGRTAGGGGGASFYDNPANRWGAAGGGGATATPTQPYEDTYDWGMGGGSGVMYNPVTGFYESAPGGYNEWGAGQWGAPQETVTEGWY